jgi:hypothetical protein
MSGMNRRTVLKLVPAVPVLAMAAGARESDAAYSIGSWAANYGNHRARVRVTGPAEAVRVRIPWRRRDRAEEKDIVVIDAATGREVSNLLRLSVNREACELVFQPATAPGEYHVYYLTFTAKPVAHRYETTYTPPREKADPTWAAAHREAAFLPSARLLDIQARSDFDCVDPMEVIATAEETHELVAQHADETFLLFPEERQFPIRMTRDLPLRWIRAGTSKHFRGEALRGEFYVFQVGVYAARAPIKGLEVDFRGALPATAFRCFNLGGTDWLGRPFTKEFRVEHGRVGALWFGVQIPREVAPGEYRNTIALRPKGGAPMTVDLTLSVTPRVVEDGGDSELWRQARLRWLDSKIGLEETVTAPYTPLAVRGRTVECLGREARFAPTGLPESIRANGEEILAAPIALLVETADGVAAPRATGERTISETPASLTREFTAETGAVSMTCWSRMEFDGYINFRVRMKTARAVEVRDIRLEIPLRREVATYFMGLGKKGGYRPARWDWTWDINHANNHFWIGEAHAGLYGKLKNPEDTWDYPALERSGIPDAWGNGGRGKVVVTEEGASVVLRATSGARSLAVGQELLFCFSLMATPLKPLDRAHWGQRYYHMYAPPEEAAAHGATIINIHHGNDINPHINYPFHTTERLAAYLNDAHQRNLKVKIYYTVRELSNRVAEMWALRSLGTEVFIDGPGGGHSWLREHLVENYWRAWHHVFPDGQVDAAIYTTSLSRWHNYYLEGLSWLVRKVGIDGLYLDGIGYNREVMKRVRRVLDGERQGCLIDFHSGNEYDYMDRRVSPACAYLEHFPYVNSLWFGELYNYDESPDYWLVEISGIPFGLFGEMLERNGNPWRGMLYGMTARYYQGAEPKHIWKVWDEFGIQDARMVGYWNHQCPVKTDQAQVLATTYVKNGGALIALASWAKQAVRCRLAINWKALGIEPNGAVLEAPAVEGFQNAAVFPAEAEIPVEAGRGWLLRLRPAK